MGNLATTTIGGKGDDKAVKFVGEPPATVKSAKDFDFKKEEQMAERSAQKKSSKYEYIYKENKECKNKFEIKARFSS